MDSPEASARGGQTAAPEAGDGFGGFGGEKNVVVLKRVRGFYSKGHCHMLFTVKKCSIRTTSKWDSKIYKLPGSQRPLKRRVYIVICTRCL